MSAEREAPLIELNETVFKVRTLQAPLANWPPSVPEGLTSATIIIGYGAAKIGAVMVFVTVRFAVVIDPAVAEPAMVALPTVKFVIVPEAAVKFPSTVDPVTFKGPATVTLEAVIRLNVEVPVAVIVATDINDTVPVVAVRLVNPPLAAVIPLFVSKFASLSNHACSWGTLPVFPRIPES